MQIKRFLINLFIFTALFLMIAYPLQWMVDAGLRKSDYSTEYKEWDDITRSRINADIIIQGSSKAWRQISPQYFEDAFKLSTYNLGMDGQHFPMQKWRFDVYLKHNKKPKYIIQIVALNELDNPVIEYNYSQFIPFLNEGFIQRFGGHSFLDFRDFYIPLYKYCHTTGIIEAGLASFFKKHDNRNYKYKGFLAYTAPYSDDVLLPLKKQNPHGLRIKVDPMAYSDLIQMVQYCKKQNIGLILVNTPTHNNYQKMVINRDSVMNIYSTIANKYKLKFLDYSRDTICNDTAMYYNFNHLNKRGVAIFNKQLINDLKSEIK